MSLEDVKKLFNIVIDWKIKNISSPECRYRISIHCLPCVGFLYLLLISYSYISPCFEPNGGNGKGTRFSRDSSRPKLFSDSR